MWEPLGTLKKIYLVIVAVLCGFAIRLMCQQVHIPEVPGYQGVILSSGHSVRNMTCIFFALATCTFFSTIVTRRVRFEAGLYCASLGLGFLAVRAGSMGVLLRTSDGKPVFPLAVAELFLLFCMLQFCWQFLHLLHAKGWLLSEPKNVNLELANTSMHRVIALLVHVSITAGIIAILARTDSLKQVVLGVFIASLSGSVISHQSFPVRPSCWLWPGAMLVGLAGYIWAMFQHTDLSAGAIPNPLARPSPLVYASVGTAGAILGYWVSRQWHEAEEDSVLNADLLEENDKPVE